MIEIDELRALRNARVARVNADYVMATVGIALVERLDAINSTLEDIKYEIYTGVFNLTPVVRR